MIHPHLLVRAGVHIELSLGLSHTQGKCFPFYTRPGPPRRLVEASKLVQPSRNMIPNTVRSKEGQGQKDPNDVEHDRRVSLQLKRA